MGSAKGGQAITTGEAAEILGLGRERIRQLADGGQLRLLGRSRRGHRLLARASVEQYAKRAK